MALDKLREQMGKKLEWVGFDKETENYTMLFEGGYVMSFPEFMPIQNADLFLDRFLKERLSDALSVIDLSKIVEANRNDPRYRTITAVEQEEFVPPMDLTVTRVLPQRDVLDFVTLRTVQCDGISETEVHPEEHSFPSVQIEEIQGEEDGQEPTEAPIVVDSTEE